MLDFFKGKVTLNDWIFVGVVLLIAAGLGVAFFFLVHEPQLEEQKVQLAELRVLKTDLEKARELENNIDDLRKEAAKWDELVSSFEQRLPDEREIVALTGTFEQKANQIGLRVTLSALPTELDASKETIPYEVEAFGNYHQIVTFINLLERSDRYLKVSDLEIQEEEAGVSEAAFRLSTYRFLEQAPAEENSNG